MCGRASQRGVFIGHAACFCYDFHNEVWLFIGLFFFLALALLVLDDGATDAAELLTAGGHSHRDAPRLLAHRIMAHNQ